jgi:outer membrane lipoprotein-sorting protein
MRFIRTASTGRLLATILGLVVAIGAGTAIAVAAAGPGPVPPAKPLADAVHQALAAPKVNGITADISFTNNLLGAQNFTGDTVDPILQGAKGRLWLSGDHQLRLELQSNNGDAQIVVNKSSFWVSDPSSSTVYEGALPSSSASGSAQAKPRVIGKPDHGIATLAQIQTDLGNLMKRVNVSGAQPTDVAGRPAYTVSISPKHDGGLLGSAQIAWDALKGVPLRVAVYARNNATPVLELTATNIAYGAVPASTFSVTPPAGDKVVKVSTSSAAAKLHANASHAAKAARAQRDVSGVAAVSSRLPFSLSAPSRLDGLPRRSVTLLSWGGKPAALVTYGQNLGGVAVIEQTATAASPAKSSSTKASSKDQGGPGGLSLPTVSINGATGQELSTPLGTVLRFQKAGVAYTVIGSVPPFALNLAAKGL